jgi:pimeloyl-ACP methyl ester carboxylesterase
METKTYILLAGAWHCAWYWHTVKMGLEKKGYRVIAVDLPGHGVNKMSLSKQNLESYARYVSGILIQEEKPVILVGHSMSGGVACQVAEYCPQNIEKLVILSGFLLKDGESINGLQNGIKPTNWQNINEMGIGKLSADRKVTYLDPEFVWKKCYSDLKDSKIKEEVLGHLGGEAIAAQWQVAKLGKNLARVHKAYIKSLQDEMLSLALQEKMIQRGVDQVYTINAGHNSFLTAPMQLMDIFLNIAKYEK